ncbi:hypothetical protein Glove_494g24 [Diversispora epigaea]|uniref:Uncharacterized protein n=1 Tax=Diversispora epigaea TaxID=1348612 RepID=A0A397GRF5_9GLOM|nr:hypothetical protein Glove_494g24 [Diversispora epigaea]
MARDNLAIPATSAPIERVFSGGPDLVTQRRSTKSAIDPEESLLWKNIYFPSQENNNQHHDHLEDYFVSLFYELGLANPEPSLVIVNTFSNINTDVKKCLEKVARVQVDKLSTFKTEAQLQNRVKHFWLESNNQMLVLQCDVTTKNSGCIKLAKFIIEQYHNEFLRIKTPKMLAKHACIILHIHREQETTFNFICGWRKVTIETLTPQEKNLSSLLDGSLISIMKSTYPFEEILKQELLWCLLCMKYPSTENSISHIKMIISEIFKHPNFIECLKERTIMWIDEKSSTDWQYQVASNKRLLYPYSSFSAALHAYIRSLVRSPIAKMLYSLEKLSAIKTFFDIDQPENRMDSLITFWKGMFNDPKVITTDDLVEPNVYTLPQIYDLRFPFSYYFIKRIDGFKEIYLEEIAKLKQERENCDQLFIEDTTYRVFKSIVLSSILHLRDAPLEDFPELYFNDFVTVISSTDGGKKDIKLLSLILKQLLDEDKINDPFYLHIYWWTNSSTILAGFQLAQLCPTIVNDFSEKRVNLSFEDFLIQEVTIVMLNKLSESKAESINVHQIDQWHKQATKIITYTGKLIRSRKSSSFQLLRICNELVASKSISLKDIKEIIRLGLTSDEILSKEFINYVLKVLDKLEVTEKNLIPMRSFMTRCLDVISMDSQVILHLYQTIFSREPFPLIGSIISRIFAKEDDENIFFRIFENAHMILQRSPRLNVINTALKVKDLNSPMAALCCDIIQQNYFSELDMVDMIECFLSASNALLNAGVEPLQRISSIAFLKEFVGKLWDMTINTDDFTRPIAIDKIMEIGNFNVQAVLDQINNVMAIENPQIYSLKIYFLRDLRFRDFSIDDVKKFCKGQARTLPWLLSLELGDNNDNSLPFKTNNANDIESEINQTLTTVDISQLPRLWRKIGVNTFESFRAYYNGNLAQYKEQFPVLAVYFKYEERLTNVKHLWDIVKFVQLLSARLSYRLNRKEVLALTFREYISSERNEALMTAYRDFENAWNSVIDNVDRYQRHKIDIKPIMHIDQKLILALIEPKDEGVFLCEMLEYLVSIQNKFIEEIMAIKPGTCRSLRFLEDSDSFDETEGPPQYYIQSLTLKQSRKDNLISYQWEDDYDGILQFSERNLGLGRGQEIIYDLQKIEQELARYLVFEKVHIEMIENTTLFVEPFSYHMELFQSSMRIIGDIRNLIPQEPISPEKAAAIVGIPTNSFNFSPDQMDTSIDNPSDILKALEILLCFVKRSPGGGGEFLIKEYAASWASLSEISENAKFNSLLNADLKLKHLVGLYELIEEQVANTTVKYVSEKYKAPITNDLVDSLNKVIDWTIPPSQQELLPADVFTLALKRFMYRCLQGETIDENIPLYIYVCDESLYFWPSSVSQELIDNLFPDEIMVSHTFTVYEFITKQIENLIQKQHQQKQPPQEPQQQRKIKVLIRDLISGYF